jgi:hypothetical protein
MGAFFGAFFSKLFFFKMAISTFVTSCRQEAKRHLEKVKKWQKSIFRKKRH